MKSRIPRILQLGEYGNVMEREHSAREQENLSVIGKWGSETAVVMVPNSVEQPLAAGCCQQKANAPSAHAQAAQDTETPHSFRGDSRFHSAFRTVPAYCKTFAFAHTHGMRASGPGMLGLRVRWWVRHVLRLVALWLEEVWESKSKDFVSVSCPGEESMKRLPWMATGADVEV